MIDLAEFFHDCYLPRLRAKGVRESTIAEYRVVVRSAPEQLDLASVTRWLSTLDRAPATRNRYRRYLLALLRHARAVGALDAAWIDQVPAVREDSRAPRAWTVDEFSRILRATEHLDERYGRIHATDWWRSFLLTLWYTGARVETVAQALRCNLSLCERWILLYERKTRQEAVYSLPNDCVSAIRRMGLIRDPRVWPWPWRDGKKTRLYRLRRLIEIAGVPQLRHPFHAIRRSVASYIAASDGLAAACSALDHSRPAITSRHYVDPRIARRRIDVAAYLPRPHWKAG